MKTRGIFLQHSESDKIIGDQAEAIEFIANESTKFLNIPLKKLNLIKGILVIAIARDNDVIIPLERMSLNLETAGDSVNHLLMDIFVIR